MGDHQGERAVQRRAGWTREDWGSASVGATIPAVASQFLRQQRMIAIGAADGHEAVWATMLTGPAGFAHASPLRWTFGEYFRHNPQVVA